MRGARDVGWAAEAGGRRSEPEGGRTKGGIVGSGGGRLESERGHTIALGCEGVGVKHRSRERDNGARGERLEARSRGGPCVAQGAGVSGAIV